MRDGKVGSFRVNIMESNKASRWHVQAPAESLEMMWLSVKVDADEGLQIIF